ncbi:MAG TPA: class I poly(R)-hydroxyalkanoic acid synthase [Burkholderiales bacterium]|nr:class I poly(R)-hydroxyalkanoic acid synthase [Burkholderiales bacterium]
MAVTEKPTPVPPNPIELARLYGDIARKSGEMMTRFMQRPRNGTRPGADEMGVGQAFFSAWMKLLTNPVKLAEMQMKLWQDYATLWQSSMRKLFWQPAQPAIEPAKGDRRFRHEDWQQLFPFDYIKQSYLIAARHLHGTLGHVAGLDEQTAKKVDFYTRQYIDALSPTNFVLTNPEVLRETVASGGQNLLKGLNNLLDDLDRGGGKLRVSMTDENAFRLGENIATTPGKVVFQNELLQLIQYAPTTKQVYRRPLLVVPPWINKYYILDLRESNSFVKWAVGEGHTVFIISWVNPDQALAGKGFDDYLTAGTLAAMDAVEEATGERQLNVIGYCLGGTLVAATLGYLAAKKSDRVAACTFFASFIDFEEAGELEVFIDEPQVKALEKRMEEHGGYLEGSEMATTFNMLRSNDLIWSFVVNNYLMGRNPFPFDLLYWNSDSTRMPAAMHSFYLRKMYLQNLLREPGGIILNGVPIDVSKAGMPLFFVGTVEDHIVPWRTVYAGAGLFPGPKRFVLAGSGHIAGIVNPPSANKYHYWTNDKLPGDPEQWLKGARQQPGSWWTDWGQWVAGHGGGKVPARVPGKGGLKAIEDAPGSYVRARADVKNAPKVEPRRREGAEKVKVK